jgi:hypothetical protein
VECNICKTEGNIIFQKLILNKYQANYIQCPSCKIVKVENPHWLDEAYQDAIATTDTGLVSRNIFLTKVITLFLFFFSNKNESFIDTAGGYGMLTRMLRDVGFRYFWEDKYCQNLFAQGFEGVKKSYKFVSAIEVLEHTVDPLDFIKNIFEQHKCSYFFFTTALFENDYPEENWWYLSPETGQHICFFNDNSMKKISISLSLHYQGNGDIHVLSKNKISGVLFKIITSKVTLLVFPFIKKVMKSRTFSDHKKMMEKLRSS